MSMLSLESQIWKRLGGRLVRSFLDQSQEKLVDMEKKLTFTLDSPQEIMVGISRHLDQIESSR